VVCPVLKLREKKRTLEIVGGGKVDFFLAGASMPMGLQINQAGRAH
jgi:hypothetical protein